MKEEIIVSGRMNPMIDPELHIWEWPIALYLFVGGLAAGLLIFASIFYLRGKSDEMKITVKVAPFLVPVLLSVGLAALIYDLRHQLYFWQLFTTIRIESPMSWGAWTLLIVTPLSILWGFTWMKEVFAKIDSGHFLFKPLLKRIITESSGTEANWTWKHKFMNDFEVWIAGKRKYLAWSNLLLGLVLGVYTGILLSAFNARPLWNTSILGPLFLVSGISTAAATIMLMSKSHKEIKLFGQIDLAAIGIEIFIIIHMFMGFMASTQVQIEAARLFLGGPYTWSFWIFVFILGLVIPAILEALELTGKKIPVIIISLLVLTGGLFLRFIIVFAGQASRYLY